MTHSLGPWQIAATVSCQFTLFTPIGKLMKLLSYTSARSIIFGLCAGCLAVTSVILGFNVNAQEVAIVKVIPVQKATLDGRDLESIPPYSKEVTLADFQKQSVKEVFAGAFSLFVLKSEDGGVLKLDNYPLDQFVQVLKGKTSLISANGSKQSFVAGQSFVIPKGYTGKWSMSPGFQILSIGEAKQVQDGAKQFTK